MRKERKEYVVGKKEKYECKNKSPPKKVNFQKREQNIQSRATEQKILTERKCINTTTKFTLTT